MVSRSQIKRFLPSFPPLHFFLTSFVIQLTRPAIERQIHQRLLFLEEASQYEPEQLVFTDESYCDKRNTARLRGWSKRGTAAVVAAPFKRGRRYETALTCC